MMLPVPVALLLARKWFSEWGARGCGILAKTHCTSTQPAVSTHHKPMATIRSLFWVILFVASTFFFTVIFEHGFSNFGENSKKEVESLKLIFGLGSKKAAAPAK